MPRPCCFAAVGQPRSPRHPTENERFLMLVRGERGTYVHLRYDEAVLHHCIVGLAGLPLFDLRSDGFLFALVLAWYQQAVIVVHVTVVGGVDTPHHFTPVLLSLASGCKTRMRSNRQRASASLTLLVE